MGLQIIEIEDHQPTKERQPGPPSGNTLAGSLKKLFAAFGRHKISQDARLRVVRVSHVLLEHLHQEAASARVLLIAHYGCLIPLLDYHKLPDIARPQKNLFSSFHHS